MTGANRTVLTATLTPLLVAAHAVAPGGEGRGSVFSPCSVASGFPEPPLWLCHMGSGITLGLPFLGDKTNRERRLGFVTLVSLLLFICLRVGLFLRNGTFSIRKVCADLGGVPGVRRVVQGGFVAGGHRFLRFSSHSGLHNGFFRGMF